MKQLYTLTIAALLAVMGLTLTACDDDDFVAYSLEGTWEGQTAMAFTYNGYTYESTYSYINFNRDPYRYSSGTGYWVDYFSSDAPWQYIANHISWTVRDEVIYVYFEEDKYEIQITNYRLNDDHFMGRFYTDTGEAWNFDLVHTSSPNWGSYRYGYWDYYYAPAQNGAKAPARPQRTVVLPTK